MDVVGGAGTYLPGDPRLIDSIVYELKSQGIFDNFRKECIADVDTKPAYQNLRQRVEGSVAGFLKSQRWKPDMNKNHVREMLRRNIYESGFLETGVERIVDQVVNPKINSIFLPQVENVVYKFLGIEKPTAFTKEEFSRTPQTDNGINNLLPKDLEAVSPEHDSFEDKKDQLVEINDKVEDDESPPFEPLEESSFVMMEENSVDSRLSGISGLASHESNHSPDVSNVQSVSTTCDASYQDSEFSKQSFEDNSLNASVSNARVAANESVENKTESVTKSEDKKSVEENKPKSSEQSKKSDHKSRSSHKRSDERSKEEDKKKSNDRHKSSSDKHRSKHDTKDKDKKSHKDKSHESSRHHSSKDDEKKHRKDDKESKSKHSLSKSSSKDDKKSKSSHRSRSKSSSEKKDDKHHKSSSSSSKKESKKDDHYDSKPKKPSRRSTDRDSSDGHSGGAQSSSSSVVDTSNLQKQSSNSQNSAHNSRDCVNNSEQTDHSEGDTSRKVSNKNDDSALSNLLNKYKEKPKFASNFQEAKKLMKIRKMWNSIQKEREALTKDKTNITESDLKEMDESEIENKEECSEYPTMSAVSKESWDAIEAKLNSENILNVDYNSYDLDLSDDKVQPDFLGFNNKLKSDDEMVVKQNEEDCLFLEVHPQNERYSRFMQFYIEFLEKQVYLKSDSLLPKSRKRRTNQVDFEKLIENNLISKNPSNTKTKNHTSVTPSKKVKVEEYRDVHNNNSTKVHLNDSQTHKLLPNEMSKPKKKNSLLANHGENFNLPLSPAESDKSFTGSVEKGKDENKPKRLSNSNRLAANNSRNQQRYSSDDLYKPRMQFTSRRRAAKHSDN